MTEEEDNKIPLEGGGGGGVRNTLVTSIAANIFDTLKSNDDIAAILNGVLDPSRTDKVLIYIIGYREVIDNLQDVLMKNLMSTINITLKDSLLRNSRGGSLVSDTMVTSETSDSMRSEYNV